MNTTKELDEVADAKPPMREMPMSHINPRQLIAVLVPVRLMAAKFYTPDHLAALDAEEEPEDEETRW